MTIVEVSVAILQWNVKRECAFRLFEFSKVFFAFTQKHWSSIGAAPMLSVNSNVAFSALRTVKSHCDVILVGVPLLLGLLSTCRTEFYLK